MLCVDCVDFGGVDCIGEGDGVDVYVDVGVTVVVVACVVEVVDVDVDNLMCDVVVYLVDVALVVDSVVV